MGNNLHISYDLHAPDQNYDDVIAEIKTLGNWAKIHQSFWYVSSDCSAEDAASRLWQIMDAGDTVYVADTTNNTAAWHNLSDKVSNFIKERWYQ